MIARILIRVLAGVAIAAPLLASAGLPPREFPHPDRIRFDGHCLTIDGADLFIYSGAFHYFRCPKELWADRFQKIRAAGFNCVETYVAWNQCEQRMPSDTNDFSNVDLRDLDDWLSLAERNGLYTIVRPGPYICAEWATGGFPEWLLNLKPEHPLRAQAWLRTDDPVFLAWSRHWYDEVCPVIARHQVTRKSPGRRGVILMQVENEYDYSGLPEEVKSNYVKALAESARANGVDVPLITCWTHLVQGSDDPVLRGIFDCCNFYPRWNIEGDMKAPIDSLRVQQPDAPLGITELQGGWFAQVGGKLSEDQDGVTAAQINNLTLYAIQNGETLLNYYMLFGGSNLGDWAARDLTTTYDYNAPIREWGGVGDRYQRVWSIGHMLQEHGARLARAETVDCDVKTPPNDVSITERRAPDGSRYFFIRTSQHAEPRAGLAAVTEKSGDKMTFKFNYQLEPFGAKILYLPQGVNDAAAGQWLPKPAPGIDRPTDLPSPVTISSVKMQTDPGPAQWKQLTPGETLPEAGIYGSGFLFCRTTISSPTPTNVLVKYPAGDAIVASINGQPASPIGGADGRSVFAAPAGPAQLQFLYENRGFVNGGKDMERPGGISGIQFVSSTNLTANLVSGWRMHEVSGPDDRPEIKPDFDDHEWPPVSVDKVDADQLTSRKTAIFRAKINLSAEDLRDAHWNLSFERIDDAGWIYVNGNKVAETADWSKAYSYNVTPRLHPGQNTIAVIVRNDDGSGGLGAPALARALPEERIPLAAVGNPAGVDQRWWEPRFKDRRWTSVPVGADTKSDATLTWYRMGFKLPAAKPDQWVPWHLHLEAAGNGFLYLNGHAIGRYWEAGPQHDFFLPECWLNFGGRKDNNLTLSLRPVSGSAGLQAARVEPYAASAEKRAAWH